MPVKPKKPCSFRGCPELTSGRYCVKHQKEVDSDYNKTAGLINIYTIAVDGGN